MSVKALTWAWAQTGLSPTEKLLLVALADNADDFGECWPGQKHLSTKTGLHRVTISSASRSLGERGLIKIKPRKCKGLQKSNLYTLNLGLMLIPCSPRLHGDVAHDYMAVQPTATLEPSIEPSVNKEPSKARPSSVLGKEPGIGKEKIKPEKSKKTDTEVEEMKKFGQEDVEAILRASKEVKNIPPGEAIKNAKKSGTRYTVSEIRKVWVSLMAFHNYGFQPEWSMKERGQVNQIQKKLKNFDILEVLELVVGKWNQFCVEVNKYKPPRKPHLGFILEHVGTAGQMLSVRQSIATMHKATPLYDPPDLTKATEIPDTKTNDDSLLEVLLNQDDDL